MRNFNLIGTVCAVSLAACSAALDSAEQEGETADRAKPPSSAASEAAGTQTSSRKFDPPAAPEGWTRVVAPVVENLAPGADISLCQYVHEPFDMDMDVLDAGGFQSLGGHHSIAYTTTANVPVGTSRVCTDEDNLSTAFIGGIGGEAGGGVKLPPGVAFRLPKGASIMLNTHFLNTTDETIDGQTIIDFQFVPADGKRTIASFFANGSLGFNVGAHSDASAMTDCELPRDLQFILFTNHMHDFGSHAKTEVVRADGSIELVHEDPKWSYEMQFKAVYSHWPLETPLMVSKGEKLRTHCNWRNTSDGELRFPREMCFGVGFFLSDGKSAPVCINGTWMER